MIFEWFSIGRSKIIRFLLHPGYTLRAEKASNTNTFCLYGIQEVTGSIPVISTRKFRKALILQGLRNFSF